MGGTAAVLAEMLAMGGDVSPIANARCEFIASRDLVSGKALYVPALADFLDNGRLDRPDLGDVADELEPLIEKYGAENIRDAFRAFFKNDAGYGYLCSVEADENGKYFINIPPNVPGFVRCFPPGKKNLKIATYVERQKDETLKNEDVDPRMAFFSHKIASELTDDLTTTKENYLEETAGLGDIHIVTEGDTVTGFEFASTADPKNIETSLVAFTSAALFNILYKNDFNADYLGMLDDLVEDKGVTVDSMISRGVPADKAAEWSDVVVRSYTNPSPEITNGDEILKTALSTARINVTVAETMGGQGKAGAIVDITNDLPCDGCGEVTDANGQLNLTVSNLPSGASDIIVEVSGVSGFASTTKSIAVIPAAAVDLEVALSPSYTLTVDCPGDNCYGIIDSIPDGISRCSYIEGESRGECSAAFESGTQVALTASPFEGYRFDGWSGDPDCADGEITMNADIACTATFTSPTVPMHMLTITKTGNGSGRVSSTPGGIDCGAECIEDSQAYDYNESVTLTARADEGSVFSGWSGAGSCGAEETCTVTMDQAYTVTASFTLDRYLLTVEKMGNGSGRVSSTPGGIDCGVECIEDSQAYDYNESVTLTARADEGSVFSGWSGAGSCGAEETCTVTMDQAYTVTASFTLDRYLLTVEKSGDGSGRVSSTPGGIDCGAECIEDSQAYDYNESVTLTARADEGSVFSGWSGVESCGARLTCTVTMDQAYTVTADFNAFGSATLSGTIGARYGFNVIGMAGKPVNLKGPACPPNGNQCEIIGSTTTGLESPLNGTYAFTGLLPGTYQLEILDINTDVFNFPSPLGGVVISTNGSENTYNPAGNVNLNSVFGRVLYDGEVVEGMTVQLVFRDTIEVPNIERVVQETETDSAGLYAFSVDSEPQRLFIHIVPASVGRKDSDFIITEAERIVGGGAIFNLNFSGPPQGGSILSN